jgi:hypothetical protein
MVCTRTETGYCHPPRVFRGLNTVAASFVSGSVIWRRLMIDIAGGALGGGRVADVRLSYFHHLGSCGLCPLHTCARRTCLTCR